MAVSQAGSGLKKVSSPLTPARPRDHAQVRALSAPMTYRSCRCLLFSLYPGGKLSATSLALALSPHVSVLLQSAPRAGVKRSKEMGLTLEQAIEVVCSMSYSCFYKSMTIHASNKIWQDVYHPQTMIGKTAYVKLTLRNEGSLVIHFKEKDHEND